MKKGISLMVLVITIIVLIILAGVVIISSATSITSTTKSQLQMDITQIEYLMNTYKIRKNGNINFDVIEFDMSGLTTEEQAQFEGETIVDNKISLYVVDLLEIDAEAVNFGNLTNGATDRYLYSIYTGKVYYELGLEVDGVKYYYVEDGER